MHVCTFANTVFVNRPRPSFTRVMNALKKEPFKPSSRCNPNSLLFEWVYKIFLVRQRAFRWRLLLVTELMEQSSGLFVMPGVACGVKTVISESYVGLTAKSKISASQLSFE
ncbi:Hypothetical_protein [Hexamita inflata]|uniref:Hypothetical_protein n=1 Tax=Hexamita inflata TaxID=28002 RepID=A0AA86UVR6_9EUKA|nr:Hypothetical protein HINF_LOCUS61380 [Hexamita inflata]